MNIAWKGGVVSDTTTRKTAVIANDVKNEKGKASQTLAVSKEKASFSFSSHKFKAQKTLIQHMTGFKVWIERLSFGGNNDTALALTPTACSSSSLQHAQA